MYSKLFFLLLSLCFEWLMMPVSFVITCLFIQILYTSLYPTGIFYVLFFTRFIKRFFCAGSELDSVCPASTLITFRQQVFKDNCVVLLQSIFYTPYSSFIMPFWKNNIKEKKKKRSCNLNFQPKFIESWSIMPVLNFHSCKFMISRKYLSNGVSLMFLIQHDIDSEWLKKKA